MEIVEFAGKSIAMFRGTVCGPVFVVGVLPALACCLAGDTVFFGGQVSVNVTPAQY